MGEMNNTHKKKVLIVCYYFTPNGQVGAIRPSKVAEHLSNDGYDVSVFTQGYMDHDGGLGCKVPMDIYRINNEPIKNEKNISEGRTKRIRFDASKNKLLYSLKQHYRYYLDLKKDLSFVRSFKKYHKMIPTDSFDVIYTTANPVGTILCGLYEKKHNPNIKWINEFRDPLLDISTPILFRYPLAKIQTKSCRICDFIVSVSQGYIDRICKDNKYGNKASMIPNGYDKKDRKIGVMPKRDKLRFIYVGSLYEGRRNLSPLFKVLFELINDELIDINKVEFVYAGNDSSYLLSQANQYELDNIVNSYGRVSHEKCIELQEESHILVLSTWNQKGEEGVFPGKFLEYMLIGKPIIGMVNGNMGNSEVSEVIKKGTLGISYEEATAKRDYVVLKEYVLNCYNQFISKGTIDYYPNKELIDRYDYKNIIRSFEELIDG